MDRVRQTEALKQQQQVVRQTGRSAETVSIKQNKETNKYAKNGQPEIENVQNALDHHTTDGTIAQQITKSAQRV